MTTTTLPLQFSQVLSVLKSAFAALTAGSRSIPLGDNGTIIKELADRAGVRAERREVRDPFRKA